MLAKNLAESVSRSFEKLDLVSPRRIVAGRRKKTDAEGDARSSSADADNRRRKRKERSSKTTAPVIPTGSKELTIARLGRFTFSLEVNNAAKKVAEVADPEKEERRKRRERRKKSRDEQNKRRVKKEGETEETDKQTAKVAEAEVRRIPSLVVVSKRQKSDRPLRASASPEKKTTEEEDFVATDYRLTFGRKHKMTPDAFSRSISHPGPPPNLDEILLAGLDSKQGIKRNNSIAGDKLRPQKSSSRLKRSETEKSSSLEWSKRLGGAGSGNSAALLLSPKPAFENRAYDKSPEPAGSKSESLSHQKSESLSYLRDQIKSSLNPNDSSSRKAKQRRSRPTLLSTKSSSLDAPSNKVVSPTEEGFYIELDSDTSSSSLSESKRRSPPTQVQSLSEDSNLGQFDNDISSSSDSEMEIVVNGQKSLGNNLGAVSRSKMVDRVVNKKESLPETQSRALLLASSLSSSSLSMSPSEDEEKSNLKQQRKKELPEVSNVDFIFPSDETASIQPTSVSVSSLSERYSRKDSASSTTSSLSLKSASRRKASKSKSSKTKKTDKSEDLDNISILTDGMG